MLLPLLALLAAMPADTARPSSAVLISIDGLRPDQVLEAERHGLRVPHLRALAARGLAAPVRGVLPTVTYPSHVTLLTGASPARHAVAANTTFDPLGRNLGGWYWYASDIAVPTLWDAVQRGGRVAANVHWPVSVGAGAALNLPQIWRTGQADDRKLLAALATPGLLPALEHACGPYADGIDETIEADERRARFALELLHARRPALLTVYFAALDHEAHRHGWRSAEARATLERLDALVGRLDSAATAAYGDRAVVAVVSDHGFADVDRQVHLATALRAAGLLRFPSDTATVPTEWDASVWPAGGTAALVVRDGAPAGTMTRVRALADSLARTPGTGVRRVLEGPLRQEGFAAAAVVVEFADGHYSGTATRGPLVTAASYRGMHGYAPDMPAMAATWLMVAPGIPAGWRPGTQDMRQVAPTLARLLGLAPLGEVPPIRP